jgi:hypothetical protein
VIGTGAKGEVLPRDDFPPRAFEMWYEYFPNKVGRQATEKAFERFRRSGKVSFEQLCIGLEAYRHKTDDRP